MSRGWPAPAKLNLFLHVVGRRPDGYHLLETLFQFVDQGDELAFRVREDGAVRRLTDLPGIPAEEDLTVRAARRLKAATGCPLGVDIEIDKRLPQGGGLGGGSSDAATVLVALNRLWGTGLDTPALAALALELGADVPVFVHGRTAFAEGVGEKLTFCTAEESAVLVIHPGCQVPTARVFRDPALTRNTPVLKIRDFSQACGHNDCEPVTRRLYPEVARALDWLGARAPARMSGTGSCVFACFADLHAAQAVGAEVPREWAWFAARRRNESPLLARLAAEPPPGSAGHGRISWGVAKR